MKKTLVVVLALAALVGCRREDWREMTVKVPSLANVDAAAYDAATNRIAVALRAYSGVSNGFREEYIVWNPTNRAELAVRFDSLLVAEMNIRKTIEETGCTVEYPVLEKGVPAGYIDTRRPEVEPPAESIKRKE